MDAVYQNLKITEGNKSSKPKKYFLLTLHRPENVDSQERFASILEALNKISSEFHLPVIYPIHPRSHKMTRHFNLKPCNIELIEPLGFLTFLPLEANASLILTDWGGVQEEACILHVPCITLRDTTERPETLQVGANILAGDNPYKILESVKLMLNRGNNWVNPFGDGRARLGISLVVSLCCADYGQNH